MGGRRCDLMRVKVMEGEGDWWVMVMMMVRIPLVLIRLVVVLEWS